MLGASASPTSGFGRVRMLTCYPAIFTAIGPGRHSNISSLIFAAASRGCCRAGQGSRQLRERLLSAILQANNEDGAWIEHSEEHTKVTRCWLVRGLPASTSHKVKPNPYKAQSLTCSTGVARTPPGRSKQHRQKETPCLLHV